MRISSYFEFISVHFPHFVFLVCQLAFVNFSFSFLRMAHMFFLLVSCLPFFFLPQSFNSCGAPLVSHWWYVFFPIFKFVTPNRGIEKNNYHKWRKTTNSSLPWTGIKKSTPEWTLYVRPMPHRGRDIRSPHDWLPGATRTHFLATVQSPVPWMCRNSYVMDQRRHRSTALSVPCPSSSRCIRRDLSWRTRQRRRILTVS